MNELLIIRQLSWKNKREYSFRVGDFADADFPNTGVPERPQSDEWVASLEGGAYLSGWHHPGRWHPDESLISLRLNLQRIPGEMIIGESGSGDNS